jgi:thioredoxin-like negative regulator of GroEL
MINEMNTAAEELEELGIAFCSVDASAHRSLAGDLNVRGVPWLKLFINGEGK